MFSPVLPGPFCLCGPFGRCEATPGVQQEGSTLRSALAVALASTGCPWPAFVPMHDPLRDAYWGVAATRQGSFAFLETDSVHISQPPPQLLRVGYGNVKSPMELCFVMSASSSTQLRHNCAKGNLFRGSVNLPVVHSCVVKSGRWMGCCPCSHNGWPRMRRWPPLPLRPWSMTHHWRPWR